jgi:hypothetical protein
MQNVFGFLASQFHVLHTAIRILLAKTESLKKGVYALLNFLCKNFPAYTATTFSNNDYDETDSDTSELFI